MCKGLGEISLSCRNAQKKTAPGHIRRIPHTVKTGLSNVTVSKRAKKRRLAPGHIREIAPHSQNRTVWGYFSYILGAKRLFLRSISPHPYHHIHRS